jgi:predicted transposase/invertase (TIGR01784 family)
MEFPEVKKTLNLPFQTFGVTVYDSLFKYILANDTIRPSFFSAFIPELHIVSSKILDEHMAPLKTLESLRHFIEGKKQDIAVKRVIARTGEMEVMFSGLRCDSTTQFVKDLALNFEDLRKAFPKEQYDGTMDFLCELDTGELALVEMQITPDDDWDKRSLAYIASAYSRQMRRGMIWKDIRTIIGINLLGGGLNDEKHWKETPHHQMRHYKFQEQIHGEVPPRFLEEIQLIQYSLSNSSPNETSLEKKEWLIFFRHAPRMTEVEVAETIKTPAVLAAFELAKLSNLPEAIMSQYNDEETRLKNLSRHIAETRAEGKAEGIKEGEEKGKEKTKKEIARNLLKNGVEISIITLATGLSEEEISGLFF